MQPTDDQLNDLLKRAQVPEPEPGYWEYFPARITAQMTPASSRRWASRIRVSRVPRLAGGFLTATAVAILIASATLWHTRGTDENQADLADPSKVYREMAALFPDRLQAIIADAHGIHVVLADEPIKSSSPPLFVKACAANGCREIITFSGQQVHVNGDTWDVLLTGQNQVLVAGPSTAKYHIESRRLGGLS